MLQAQAAGLVLASAMDHAAWLTGKIATLPDAQVQALDWYGRSRWQRELGQPLCPFTAWGNFSILTLFSGAGEELFNAHPFYYCGRFVPVRNWAGDGQDFLFVASGEQSVGLWDGEGDTVVPVPPPDDRAHHPRKFNQELPQVMAADMRGLGRDQVLVLDQDTLRIYGADFGG